MNNPAHVLLIGNEPANLRAQNVVLRHFWTVAQSTTTEFAHMLPATDVAVFCHSLTDAERQELVDAIHPAFPSVLIVKINGYDSGPHAGVDASVDLHHGPGALVSCIYQLVTERGIPSQGWAGHEFELAPGIH